MSEETAREIEDFYDEWDNNIKRRGFIERMEHKLSVKERRSSHR